MNVKQRKERKKERKLWRREKRNTKNEGLGYDQDKGTFGKRGRVSKGYRRKKKKAEIANAKQREPEKVSAFAECVEE